MKSYVNGRCEVCHKPIINFRTYLKEYGMICGKCYQKIAPELENQA